MLAVRGPSGGRSRSGIAGERDSGPARQGASVSKEEQLRPGTTVQLSDGSTALVLAPPDLQASTVRVRYVDAPFAVEQVGVERDCPIDDVTSWYSSEDLKHTEGRLA